MSKDKINPEGYDEDSLQITEGTVLILVQLMGMKNVEGTERYVRNVYLTDKDRNVIWQIKSDHDDLDEPKPNRMRGEPFTSLRKQDDGYFVFRWSGWKYKIDMETGFAIPVEYSRW